MKGLIILEGPDAVGKTTLAKAIVKRCDGHYIHMTYFKNMNVWKEHGKGLMKAVAMSSKKLVVLDRHWMSEQVYGSVFRDGPVPPHAARMMDRVILKHAGLYVMCLPSTKQQAINRYLKMKAREMYQDEGGMAKVVDRYYELYSGSHRKITNYAEQIARNGGMRKRIDCERYMVDFCEDSAAFNHKVDWIVARSQSQRQGQYEEALDSKTRNILGYLGTAETLFVGDRCNVKHERDRWPFYSDKNSSLYLANACARAGVDETKCMWTNANNGIEHLVKVLLLKPTLHVVALGEQAAKTIRDVGVTDFKTIYHPAYYKRFHAGKDYSIHLRSALQYEKCN